MRPANFEFHVARTSAEAVALLGRYDGDARILAGGQSLVPLMNFRVLQPRALVSINHCPELAYIRKDGDFVAFGASARQIEAERSSLVQEQCPLLAAALPWVGGVANRNRGTICGSLAHADPLAEIPAVAVALDAQFQIGSARGSRTVAARDFFVTDLTTLIEPGEMLQSVKFPVSGKNTGSAFVEIGNRAHGFAIVGVAAHLEFDDSGRCKSARLAAIGVGNTPVRLVASEAIMNGSDRVEQASRDAASAAASQIDPSSGFHADAAYKTEVIGVLVERAINRAHASYNSRPAH